VISTALLLFVLYLPRLWGGKAFDLVRVLGSAVVGRDNQQSRFMGMTAFFLVGLLFAVGYGVVAEIMLLDESPTAGSGAMQLTHDDTGAEAPVASQPGLPLRFDARFPMVGTVLGLIHGLVITAIVVGIILPRHPLPKYRLGGEESVSRSQATAGILVSHLVFGTTVMLFHHQLLRLLLPLT